MLARPTSHMRVMLIVAAAVALLAAAPLRAADLAPAADSTQAAPAVESSAPPDVAPAESTAQAVGPVMAPLPTSAAEPAQAQTAVQAPKVDSTAVSEFPVTIDEVKSMLSSGRTPRLRVTNKYGGVLTGRAVEITGGRLSVDVSGEDLGVDGVMGIALANIVSIRALVSLTDKERAEAEKATADYIALIGANAQGPSAESTASSSTAQAGAESTDQNAAASQEGEKDLLAIYPPKDGWGPEKLGEINRRFLVLHEHPFGKDEDFVNDYDAWKEAYEKKRNEQIDQMTELQAAGKPIPPDFKVLRELPPVPSLLSPAQSTDAASADQQASPAATPAPEQ